MKIKNFRKFVESFIGGNDPLKGIPVPEDLIAKALARNNNQTEIKNVSNIVRVITKLTLKSGSGAGGGGMVEDPIIDSEIEEIDQEISDIEEEEDAEDGGVQYNPPPHTLFKGIKTVYRVTPKTVQESEDIFEDNAGNQYTYDDLQELTKQGYQVKIKSRNQQQKPPSGKPKDDQPQPSEPQQGQPQAGKPQPQSGQQKEQIEITPNDDGTYTDQHGRQLTQDNIDQMAKAGNKIVIKRKEPTEGEESGDEGIEEPLEESDPSADDIARNLRNSKARQKMNDPKYIEKRQGEIEKANEQIIEDEEYTEEYANKRIREAKNIHTAGGTGGGGSSGEKLQDKLVEKLKTKIPWREALKRFFKKPGSIYWDIKRPWKRFHSTEVYLPKATKPPNKKISEFVVAIDESGSLMGSEAFSYFISETMKIFETVQDGVRILVLLYGNQVTDAYMLNQSNFQKLLHARPEGGGNDMDSVAPYIQKYYPNFKPVGVIFFTDGWEDPPNLPPKINECEIEYMFFLVPNGNAKTVQNFGKVYWLTPPSGSTI